MQDGGARSGGMTYLAAPISTRALGVVAEVHGFLMPRTDIPQGSFGWSDPKALRSTDAAPPPEGSARCPQRSFKEDGAHARWNELATSDATSAKVSMQGLRLEFKHRNCDGEAGDYAFTIRRVVLGAVMHIMICDDAIMDHSRRSASVMASKAAIEQQAALCEGQNEGRAATGSSSRRSSKRSFGVAAQGEIGMASSSRCSPVPVDNACRKSRRVLQNLIHSSVDAIQHAIDFHGGSKGKVLTVAFTCSGPGSRLNGGPFHPHTGVAFRWQRTREDRPLLECHRRQCGEESAGVVQDKWGCPEIILVPDSGHDRFPPAYAQRVFEAMMTIARSTFPYRIARGADRSVRKGTEIVLKSNGHPFSSYTGRSRSRYLPRTPYAFRMLGPHPEGACAVRGLAMGKSPCSSNAREVFEQPRFSNMSPHASRSATRYTPIRRAVRRGDDPCSTITS